MSLRGGNLEFQNETVPSSFRTAATRRQIKPRKRGGAGGAVLGLPLGAALDRQRRRLLGWRANAHMHVRQASRCVASQAPNCLHKCSQLDSKTSMAPCHHERKTWGKMAQRDARCMPHNLAADQIAKSIWGVLDRGSRCGVHVPQGRASLCWTLCVNRPFKALTHPGGGMQRARGRSQPAGWRVCASSFPIFFSTPVLCGRHIVVSIYDLGARVASQECRYPESRSKVAREELRRHLEVRTVYVEERHLVNSGWRSTWAWSLSGELALSLS